MNTAAKQRLDRIAEWLQLFLDPHQITELRALHVGESRALSRYYRTDQVYEMADEALLMESRGAMGVYFIPNPLREDIIGTKAFAKDGDVIARHWLLVDCDPVRFDQDGQPLADQKCPATVEERRAAWDVMESCRLTLQGAGFSHPILADSGNGWHLLYRIDLPANDTTRDQCKALLKGLDKRCSNAKARVDTATYNAARIWKLYGTFSRKGEPSQVRPWRMAKVVEL